MKSSNIINPKDNLCDFARILVMNYYDHHRDKSDSKEITFDDTYVVWSAYILGNRKCLVSTTASDGMYYEVTYDANKDLVYFDAYKRWDHHEYNKFTMEKKEEE